MWLVLVDTLKMYSNAWLVLVDTLKTCKYMVDTR